MYTVETLRVRWRYTMSNMWMILCLLLYMCYVWGEYNVVNMFCVYCYTVETLRVRWRYTMSNNLDIVKLSPMNLCLLLYMYTVETNYVWGEDMTMSICLVCQTIPNDSVFIVIYVHSRNITCEWGEDIQCLICLVCQTIPNDSVFYCYICTQSKHYVWGEDIQCLICLVCQTIPMILCLLLYM